jgi:hypothetical protein
MNAKDYLDKMDKKGKITKDSLYEITYLTDKNVISNLTEESNPILNSFLSKDHSSFSFILPTNESGPNALTFNESVFLSRAIGLTSDGISVNGSKIYNTVKRAVSSDRFIRDEVYSVTGLKTERVPYSLDQIMNYARSSYQQDKDDNVKGNTFNMYTP